MQPYVQFLVSLGQWAQAHQDLVLFSSLAVVVILGIARLGWRLSLYARRPRR